MISVDRIDHLVLTCRDMPATIRFYTKVLGMREVTFGPGRKALAFGGQKINLHAASHASAGVAALPAAPTAGSADLCLIVNEPLSDVVAHLDLHGVPVHEGPVARTGATGSIMSVYVRDPDGNLIELSNYAA
jgi:catechol 2,3-dioxygenase-like lactoylglutathione lyase family enzyme